MPRTLGGGRSGKRLPACAGTLVLDRAILLGVRRTMLEEPPDRLREPFVERSLRLPAEEIVGLAYVGDVPRHLSEPRRCGLHLGLDPDRLANQLGGAYQRVA